MANNVVGTSGGQKRADGTPMGAAARAGDTKVAVETEQPVTIWESLSDGKRIGRVPAATVTRSRAVQSPTLLSAITIAMIEAEEVRLSLAATLAPAAVSCDDGSLGRHVPPVVVRLHARAAAPANRASVLVTLLASVVTGDEVPVDASTAIAADGRDVSSWRSPRPTLGSPSAHSVIRASPTAVSSALGSPRTLMATRADEKSARVRCHGSSLSSHCDYQSGMAR